MSRERAENQQGRERTESRTSQPAKSSSGLLRSGVDAREAARLSVEARRERKVVRERDAELDRLTVAQRTGVALAAEVKSAELRAILRTAVTIASDRDHPRWAQAAKLVLDMTRFAIEEPEQGEETAETRAVSRAELRGLLDALDEQDASTPPPEFAYKKKVGSRESSVEPPAPS